MRKYLACLAAPPGLHSGSPAPALAGKPHPWSPGAAPQPGLQHPTTPLHLMKKRRGRHGEPQGPPTYSSGQRGGPRAPESGEQGRERRLHFPHVQNPLCPLRTSYCFLIYFIYLFFIYLFNFFYCYLSKCHSHSCLLCGRGPQVGWSGSQEGRKPGLCYSLSSQSSYMVSDH